MTDHHSWRGGGGIGFSKVLLLIIEHSQAYNYTIWLHHTSEILYHRLHVFISIFHAVVHSVHGTCCSKGISALNLAFAALRYLSPYFTFKWCIIAFLLLVYHFSTVCYIPLSLVPRSSYCSQRGSVCPASWWEAVGNREVIGKAVETGLQRQDGGLRD